MLINLAESNFYCFGCGVNGDAIEFVKLAYPKKDDLSSVFMYHKILKSNKVKDISISDKKNFKTKREIDYDALDVAHDFYYGLKTDNWKKLDDPAKDYMNKRGFKDSTLNRCKAKLTYMNNYPLVFPMFDNEEFKGWVCRTTNKRIEEKRKYLYNKGFSRANTVVGDYSDTKVVIMVEGYMDRLKLIQMGAKKVVAILGWKATEEQIQKLKDAGVETIISALDNDDCGKKGTAFLKKHFHVIRFRYKSKDPGDMSIKEFETANQKAKEEYRRLKANGKRSYKRD